MANFCSQISSTFLGDFTVFVLVTLSWKKNDTCIYWRKHNRGMNLIGWQLIDYFLKIMSAVMKISTQKFLWVKVRPSLSDKFFIFKVGILVSNIAVWPIFSRLYMYDPWPYDELESRSSAISAPASVSPDGNPLNNIVFWSDQILWNEVKLDPRGRFIRDSIRIKFIGIKNECLFRRRFLNFNPELASLTHIIWVGPY